MEKKIKIILLIVIIIIAVISVLLATRWIAFETYKQVSEMVGSAPEKYAPNVTYEKNETARTITITLIEGEPGELLWSNVELYNPNNMYSMEATLPNGTIDVGDVITDCDGLIWLRWKPTGGNFIQDVFD
jgi:hypothetical protein